MHDVEPQFVTVSTFAKTFGVSRYAVYKWIGEGLIKALDFNGMKRIPVSEVQRVKEHGLDQREAVPA
jgi:predicted site-specific integrase-resolvase